MSKTIRTKVFSFNELSEEAKKVAIKNEINDYQRNGEPLMFFDEYFKEIAKEEGFFINKLCYSLSYCQGDGLSFSGSIDIDKLLNEFKPVLKQSVKEVIKLYLCVNIRHNNGHYCYASNKDIDIFLNDNLKEYKNIENLVSNFENFVRVKYLELCKELESEGYNIIEREGSEEAATDRLNDSENLYTKDGKIFNY